MDQGQVWDVAVKSGPVALVLLYWVTLYTLGKIVPASARDRDLAAAEKRIQDMEAACERDKTQLRFERDAANERVSRAMEELRAQVNALQTVQRTRRAGGRP
jgi:hypothetical protein